MEGPAHYYESSREWRPTSKGWWRLVAVVVLACLAAAGVYYATR